MFAVDVFGIGRAVTVLKAENAIRIRANSLNVVRIGDESFMLVGVVVDNELLSLSFRFGAMELSFCWPLMNSARE